MTAAGPKSQPAIGQFLCDVPGMGDGDVLVVLPMPDLERRGDVLQAKLQWLREEDSFVNPPGDALSRQLDKGRR